MRLQLLHVPDCPNTAVLAGRLHALIAGRRDVVVEHRVIRDEAEAVGQGMAGSPTLLVDGVDPFGTPGGSASLSCRLYVDEAGVASGAPSLAQLRAALGEGVTS